ncbi:rho GTPase-activating protein 27-like isoform X2 [Stegastes partitus]|uniref:Rho GTPase-activating protein 27-like n=1 Tax=Stegastes partitus TaxID=144197 RepID=A0A3B5AAC5_9TELE|nr:PREDICTED: rho GTPase-activating protein 27-like isoform X2 [Stegastes partitus]
MAATSSLLSRVAGLGLVLVKFEYEYEGRDGELVSIKPNERYYLLAKTNDHWWQVRRDASSKPFYIPAQYVKELPLDFPSPLDFTDPSGPEPVLLPVEAPVPVPIPVPIPKPLEEPSGPKTKAGDEVTIRLRPDGASRHHKHENRMSTFGVPLDFHDPAPWRPSSPTAATDTAATATGETTNMADSKKPGFLDDQADSGKSRVPSFSPADPVSTPRPQNQPIPVETPVVPPLNNIEPAGHHDDQESAMEEEEEVAEEETSSEDSCEGPQNHIYESIQDLNLDLDALIGGRESPGAPPPTAPAPPPTQDSSSLGPNAPIYANVSPLKKTIHLSVPGPALPSPPPHDPAPSTGHTPSTSGSSSGMLSPASPVSPQDGWQAHTDQDSGKVFYYHPLTRQTTWSDPHRSPASPTGDQNQTRGPLGSPLLSPASSQGSCVWEQLVDEVSGRFYYYNPTTGATSWALPEPLSPSSPPGSNRDNVPPPLPEEDYPVENDNNVFTTNPQQHVSVIPRAQLDPKDPTGSQWRQQELLHLPQRMMGNGVSEEGPVLQVRNWRHSVAEDTFSMSHRRNFSDVTELSNRRPSPDSPQSLLLEKAGIINKTKVVDNGKKIRKNWSQSWTVLHGGILTFHKDPKSAPTGNASKASQIVPEYTVELRGSTVGWASKDKSSKKNVLELKTRQGCEYLMQYDTESIISDWLKVMQDTIRQLELDHLSEDEDEASDKEDKDRKRTSNRNSSGADSEQRRVRTKLRRFLQRRPTLQSVKEKGYIRDNVFGCHLDTLCHRENTTIPKFVEKCIKTVERRGLDVDGIYRVSGNLAVIQKLRHKADHEEQLDLEDGQWEEIHVITGALKLFLRELPEPLFPFSCFDKFIAAIQVPDYTLRVSYMKDLVRTLPLPNHDTMELLFKHLRRVIEHKESNRMSVQSVAIVFGPTLLRPQTESANMTIHMVFQSQIVELMLNEFQTVFSQS